MFLTQLWEVASFSPLLWWQMGSLTIVLVSESWQLVFIILLLDFNFTEIIIETGMSIMIRDTYSE